LKSYGFITYQEDLFRFHSVLCCPMLYIESAEVLQVIRSNAKYWEYRME
jgi:hypothetical protein